MNIFEADSGNEAWLSAARRLMTSEDVQSHTGRGGATRELLPALFILTSPRDRWVVSRLPPINVAFALAEAVWIIRGRNDSNFLNFWNSQLPNYAGPGKTYHGAYGHRLRIHYGIDQLNRVFQGLWSNPNTRQGVLQIWDPRIDLPIDSGEPVAMDIPCNICSLLEIRDGKLMWTQIMRSNDLYLGTPYNFVQFTILQEVMAGWLNLEPGPYYQLSNSLHAYVRDLKKINNSLPEISIPKNDESLAVPKIESEKAWEEIERLVDSLLRDEVGEAQLPAAVNRNALPQAYKSILAVLAAEYARRRRWHESAGEVIGVCSNRCLRLLWERWCGRSKVKAVKEERTCHQS